MLWAEHVKTLAKVKVKKSTLSSTEPVTSDAKEKPEWGYCTEEDELGAAGTFHTSRTMPSLTPSQTPTPEGPGQGQNRILPWSSNYQARQMSCQVQSTVIIWQGYTEREDLRSS
ncbi:hypothetical protein WISP_94745 [Willisornis vidua]|uniref:Uncharacterized protein n=1 Tax=Willisornis vidua TaxID=1566151 RepID=A0ABQ9D0I6_9PASS|nr:hypothetical protein WISP_94745 [Willisornis vidua]